MQSATRVARSRSPRVLCWCRFCQYIAAGNATVSVCFLTAHMTIAGKTRDYEGVADSETRSEHDTAAATIWTTKAPRWTCIDTSLPTFESQPPPVAQAASTQPTAPRFPFSYGRMTLAERSAKVSGCTISFFCATGVKPSFW
ncbi:hypothetical protein [Mesorhizobium sp. WSM3860]|uniref:hypothetical protein n=1 Tax=Mesorhizobium sp. WSM3860 TaxID=2029403 RepID=UPI0015969543|nr:hypothetical protein [Mesorhizobium sp. WSM3860]